MSYAMNGGGHYGNGSHLAPHEEEEDEEVAAARRDSAFIDEWCTLYGLGDDMADYLLEHGYRTGDDLLTLYVPDINKFDMDIHRKCLLRGAILQYRQLRGNTDRELERRGVTVVNKTHKKKDFKSMWKSGASRVTTMDSIVMRMLKPDERERIRDLRRRLHTKRSSANQGNGSLYERILQNRGLGRRPTGSLSDGTESLSSTESGSYKSLSPDDNLPPTEGPTRGSDSPESVYVTASNTPIRDVNTANSDVISRRASLARGESVSKDEPIPEPPPAEEPQPAEKVKKKKKKTKEPKKKKTKAPPKETEPDTAEVPDEEPKQEKPIAKKSKAKAKKKVDEDPEVQLENKLEEMLTNLDRLSKEPLGTPRGKDLTPAESAAQTARVLEDLEQNLFTDEERALIEQQRQEKLAQEARQREQEKLEEEIRDVMHM